MLETAAVFKRCINSHEKMLFTRLNVCRFAVTVIQSFIKDTFTFTLLLLPLHFFNQERVDQRINSNFQFDFAGIGVAVLSFSRRWCTSLT